MQPPTKHQPCTAIFLENPPKLCHWLNMIFNIAMFLYDFLILQSYLNDIRAIKSLTVLLFSRAADMSVTR